ncbi:hypothetical protein [Calothrix sp. UHCC 0171]|uniref:hypothetical protein n=1 Tax=Calothrix sp. UHCC 0171 TaxID=3110245 RepID=UPI002B1EBA11|nr:hypothetical protein [Calothrix sp. UHCC 0171]MEA5570264.1 hypothetical protein [Calothrix sp. UHCC 0171]
MSEQTIEGKGKGFLVLLLPISFLIVFLVSTWRIWLGLILLITGINLWRNYQWQKWSQGVNPIFHQLVQQNQGSLSPIDLAIKGNFSASSAKRFLDNKASEFGASILNTEDGKQVYYFMTANILGDILDSSEPVKELSSSRVAKASTQLLASPTVIPAVLAEKEVAFVPEKELVADIEPVAADLNPPATLEEAKKTLAKQLTFGSLIQSELAKRLNVYSSTVFKRRGDVDFPEWSRSRDPDGIAWRYDRKTREFFPIDT